MTSACRPTKTGHPVKAVLEDWSCCGGDDDPTGIPNQQIHARAGNSASRSRRNLYRKVFIILPVGAMHLPS
jgi:hypothetical protein